MKSAFFRFACTMLCLALCASARLYAAPGDADGAQEPYRLPCGMRLVSQYQPGQEMVAILYCFSSGRLQEPKPGASRLLVRTCLRGTEALSPTDVVLRIASLGANTYADSGYNTCYIGGESPAENFQALAELALDLTFRPRLDPKSVEVERRFALDAVERQEDFSSFSFGQRMMTVLWPKHPISRLGEGTKRSLDALCADDLRRLHAERFVPSACHVFVFGGVAGDEVRRVLLKVTAGLKPGVERAPSPAEALDSTAALEIGVRKIIQKSGSQADIFIGRPVGDVSRRDELLIALLDEALFGFEGKLSEPLRRSYGNVYYVNSTRVLVKGFGLWGVKVGTKSRYIEDVEKITREHLAEAVRSGISREGMQIAAASLETRMLRNACSVSDGVFFMQKCLSRGWPFVDVRQQVATLKTIKRREVNEMARKLYNDGKLITIINK